MAYDPILRIENLDLKLSPFCIKKQNLLINGAFYNMLKQDIEQYPYMHYDNIIAVYKYNIIGWFFLTGQGIFLIKLDLWLKDQLIFQLRLQYYKIISNFF